MSFVSALQILLVALVLSGLVWRLRQLTRMDPLDRVPGPPRASWAKGNLGQIFNMNGYSFHDHILADYGTVVKVHGVFGSKKLYTSDPKAIYDVLVKNHGAGYSKTPANLDLLQLVFGKALPAIKDHQHRKQRKMMNPVFSIAHMKYMTRSFYDVTERLRIALKNEVGSNKQEIEMLNWMTRTALELVGQAGLGYAFDPLIDQPKNAYGTASKELIPALAPIGPYREIIRGFTCLNMPRLFGSLLPLVPLKDVQRLRNIVETMDRESRHIYREKQEAVIRGDERTVDQLQKGKDIMSILLRANSHAVEEDRLPDDEVIAQMSNLIFAAMETTSGSLARILQLFAEHPGYQSDVRQELREACPIWDENLSYEVLDALPLLDACCRETLRLHPPVSVLIRQAQTDMVLPLSSPITSTDGAPMTEVMVPRGTDIILSIRGINRSTAIWGEDALEWKPERWLRPLPQTVLDARIPGVYSHMLTFSAGSTACIGFKFALLEMKVVLSMLLRHFSFASPDKEVFWKMGPTQFPCIRGGQDSMMPLQVSSLA